jgi:RNA polymerase sigma factor (TIGR02999 family)
VYLRLTRAQQVDWQDRAHFFALAARIMRRILVDAARARSAEKRGGAAPVAGSPPADLDALPSAESETAVVLCALDDALHELAIVDSRRAKVIELRFFGGLSVEETASLLEVSPQTVMRDWRLAKVWLARQLGARTPAA